MHTHLKGLGTTIRFFLIGKRCFAFIFFVWKEIIYWYFASKELVPDK